METNKPYSVLTYTRFKARLYPKVISGYEETNPVLLLDGATFP